MKVKENQYLLCTSSDNSNKPYLIGSGPQEVGRSVSSIINWMNIGNNNSSVYKICTRIGVFDFQDKDGNIYTISKERKCYTKEAFKRFKNEFKPIKDETLHKK